MSDRKQLINIKTGIANQGIQLFMDGESGTYRLFLIPEMECVDLTLSALRKFHNQLDDVIKQIENDPDSYNAEVRASWKDE